MKHYVTIVPECPKCHSKKVAYYIISIEPNGEDTMIRYMRHGELVIPRSFHDGSTCCCTECGLSWYGQISHKWVSEKEFKEIKKERGISKEEIKKEAKYFDEKMDEEKKVKKKRHNKKGKEVAKSIAKLIIWDSTIGAIIDALPKNHDIDDYKNKES